jgi:hypothetical protein
MSRPLDFGDGTPQRFSNTAGTKKKLEVFDLQEIFSQQLLDIPSSISEEATFLCAGRKAVEVTRNSTKGPIRSCAPPKAFHCLSTEYLGQLVESIEEHKDVTGTSTERHG